MAPLRCVLHKAKLLCKLAEETGSVSSQHDDWGNKNNARLIKEGGQPAQLFTPNSYINLPLLPRRDCPLPSAREVAESFSLISNPLD